MRAYLPISHKDLEAFVLTKSFDADEVFAPTQAFVSDNSDCDEEELEYLLSIAAGEEALDLRLTEKAPGIVLAFEVTDEQIAEFVTKSRGEQEFRELRPVVKIDGWLSTTGKISERDRQALELYWKKWFSTLDLDEPDFGFGIMDWSVD